MQRGPDLCGRLAHQAAIITDTKAELERFGRWHSITSAREARQNVPTNAHNYTEGIQEIYEQD